MTVDHGGGSHRIRYCQQNHVTPYGFVLTGQRGRRTQDSPKDPHLLMEHVPFGRAWSTTTGAAATTTVQLNKLVGLTRPNGLLITQFGLSSAE